MLELQHYFAPPEPDQKILAVPGAGLQVPLWILGSSLFGAASPRCSACRTPSPPTSPPPRSPTRCELYRAEFQPSQQLDKPYVMAGVNVVAAETEAEARRHFTSIQQQFTNLVRGTPGQLPPPIDDVDAYWTPEEELPPPRCCRAHSSARPTRSASNSTASPLNTLDELIVASAIYDHAARLRSYELLAQ